MPLMPGWMMDPENLEGRNFEYYRRTKFGPSSRYDRYEPRIQPGGERAMEKTGSDVGTPARAMRGRKFKEPGKESIGPAAALMNKYKHAMQPDKKISGELYQMARSGDPKKVATAQLAQGGLKYLVALRNSVGSENKYNQIAKLIKQGSWPWDKDPFGGGPNGIMGPTRQLL